MPESLVFEAWLDCGEKTDMHSPKGTIYEQHASGEFITYSLQDTRGDGLGGLDPRKKPDDWLRLRLLQVYGYAWAFGAEHG